MTQAQMIELVQQHHPAMGTTLVRLNLNRAKDDYCSETGIIKSNSLIISVAGQRYYVADSDNLILKVTDVQIDNVYIPRLVGSPLIDDNEYGTGDANLATPTTTSTERYWFMNTKNSTSPKIGIVEKGTVTKNNKTSNYQSISVSDSEIRIFGIFKDYPFDATGTGGNIGPTESPNFPTQFHEALVYRTISEGYTMAGTQAFEPKAAQYFDAKYLELVKKGRKYNRFGSIGGAINITPTSF